MASNKTAILWAILAAALYALNSPVSKLLLGEIPPTMMAALLYLGAGIGLTVVRLAQRLAALADDALDAHRVDDDGTGRDERGAALQPLNRGGGVAGEHGIFKEAISKRLWAAIGLMTLSSIVLTVEDASSFSFSLGSVFVLLACVCWGFENNCTRMISNKDPLEIVVIKGFGSGLGSLAIALFQGEAFPKGRYIACALLLGFVAYGLSIFFYIYAQRYLGAAKTSTYYAVAPFIGVALSLAIFREIPTVSFLVALVIMAAGTFVSGSSIELSADAPIEPPYAVYFQGGLTWHHARFGIMMSLQKLYEEKLITL